MVNYKIEKTIYFVRHGQSEGNIAPVFQSTRSPLSKTGLKQAEYIAKRVSNISFDALIASPLQRAKQTAEAIAYSTKKEVEYSNLFVERIKPTYINGKPYTDDKANTLWREWEKSLYTPDIRAEDGENYNDLLERADKALAYLQQRTENSIVVVSHGYFLQTIVARVLLGDAISSDVFRNFHKNALMENTGLTVLRYQSDFEEDSAWRLWTYNDNAHLG